ncbi:Rne/Rng family ribonuclease [Pseudalkalibacillus sp. Hm43]|uniref:Rne/Rng family ribonuclease n=1 Tax=Pseudalkalibacillus sp. Hm43 TaxID=3450742 RepID=UPI003F431ED0
MNKIIFNLTTSEKRAAILQDGKVVEILIERPEEYPKAGNVYVGQVSKVLPGIHAAFIDIGFEQNGFIHSTDLVKNQDQQPINELVHEGQSLIVQVKREASKNKGPLLTENITVPGENLVYLPFSGHIALSKKLSDEDKVRMKQLGEDLITSPEGLIMRTSSASTDIASIGKEIKELREVWTSIQEDALKVKKSGLLFEGHSIVDTALNHVPDQRVGLVFDNADMYRRYRDQLPDPYEVSMYRGSENIFSHYQIEPVIQKALLPSVWLKNGGQIQIDSTEALTVVDVNTGKFTGKQDRERTVLETNLLAAEEAGKQLRLRNISGMIVIDFIRMSKEEHQKEVEMKLREVLSKDPIHTKVYGFTALGLMELTRQKVRDSLSAQLTESCSTCDSYQKQWSVESLYHQLERMLYELRNTEETGVWIELSHRLYQYVTESGYNREKHLLDQVPAQLYITEKSTAKLKEFHVRQIGPKNEIEARIRQESR